MSELTICNWCSWREAHERAKKRGARVDIRAAMPSDELHRPMLECVTVEPDGTETVTGEWPMQVSFECCC